MSVFYIIPVSTEIDPADVCHGAVPEQPRNLRGESVSATSIRLTWTAPHTVGSDPVTSYKLYYNDSTCRNNVHLTISPPVSSYLLEHLSPKHSAVS